LRKQKALPGRAEFINFPHDPDGVEIPADLLERRTEALRNAA
jgi:hypothetical protein